MVDCTLLDLGQVSQESRRSILNYLINNKGIKPKDLNITPRYMAMLKSGQKPITDNVLCEMLRYLSHEELQQLLRGFVPEREATLDELLRVIATARSNPTFRDVFISFVSRYLGDYLSSVGRTWHVTQDDVDSYIRSMRLDGRAEKTIRDRVHYITKALSALNWSLEPESLRDYLAELKDEEGEHVLRHVAASLKSFLKRVLKPRDPGLFSILYSSFTTYRPRSNNKRKLPSIEELRAVFNAIESIEAKAYFIILAETGLRPGEPFLITVDDVDLDHGMLRVGKVTETKRSFIAFLRPETLEWVKKYYMPRREEFLNMVLPGMSSASWSSGYAEALRSRFMPFDRARLRNEIREASLKAIGREIELYDLRKFFASWMIVHGVPETIVNTLQGRAPPTEYRVLIEHYWSPRHEELRNWYLKHAPCILCS